MEVHSEVGEMMETTGGLDEVGQKRMRAMIRGTLL